MIASSWRVASQRLLMTSMDGITRRRFSVLFDRRIAHIKSVRLVASIVARTLRAITVTILRTIAVTTRRRSVHWRRVTSRRTSVVSRGRRTSSVNWRTLTRSIMIPIIIRIKFLRQLGFRSRTALRRRTSWRCIVGIIVLPKVDRSPWRPRGSCCSVGKACLLLLIFIALLLPLVVRVRLFLAATLLLVVALLGLRCIRLILFSRSRFLLPKMKSAN